MTANQDLSEYVVGFAFNDAKTHVLMMLKDHPDFQVGKWNGLGERIQPMEAPRAAMVREYAEECGITTEQNDWHHSGLMSGIGWNCHVFTIVGDPYVYKAKKLTREPIDLLKVSELPRLKLLHNVLPLVTLCLMGQDHNGRQPFFTISY